MKVTQDGTVQLRLMHYGVFVAYSHFNHVNMSVFLCLLMFLPHIAGY